MKPRKKKNLTIFLAACMFLLIGFLVGYLTGFKYGIKVTKESRIPSPPQPFFTQVPSLDLNSETMKIVKELNCVCGCKRELLPCTCDEPRGSVEIKQFIQERIKEGLSKSQVIKLVVEKYGSAVLKKNL
ncbi:MAG: cytochrome c-type biogenesis protein CcmH [Candidatus Aminicenantales bacterium]